MGTIGGMFVRDFTDYDAGNDAPLAGGAIGAVVAIGVWRLFTSPNAGSPPIYR
jgi:hypothetical protein